MVFHRATCPGDHMVYGVYRLLRFLSVLHSVAWSHLIQGSEASELVELLINSSKKYQVNLFNHKWFSVTFSYM